MTSPRFMREYASYIVKTYSSASMRKEGLCLKAAVRGILARYEMGMLSIKESMTCLGNIEECAIDYRKM